MQSYTFNCWGSISKFFCEAAWFFISEQLQGFSFPFTEKKKKYINLLLEKFCFVLFSKKNSSFGIIFF